MEQGGVLNLIAGLCFLGYFVLAVWCARYRSPSDAPTGEGLKRRISWLILYALSASFTAGLTQRDLFPFASWQLIAARVPPVLTYPRIKVVDHAGEEHAVDNRAWQPLSDDDLLAWMNRDFTGLDSASQDAVGRYLLDLVEGARREARRTGHLGYFDRVLGPLAAPPFVLHPHLWSSAQEVPAEPLVGIRFYREAWSLEGRARGQPTARRLVYQYPRTP